DHGDEDDHDDHGHNGVDPHFFNDPLRMAQVVDSLSDFLITNVKGIDSDALADASKKYVDAIKALDVEIVEMFSLLPLAERVLITNHEVFGYFAERYEFEVLGTIIPTGSTLDSTNAKELVELVEVIKSQNVKAIFSDVSASNKLADTLAQEVGEIRVVELFSESLGLDNTDASTYLDMQYANSSRIAEALRR
ncbi:MAG: metal ABC transporter solute-binding protein, Zn/Mn family, partial [Acidimicrobiales bacterium]